MMQCVIYKSRKQLDYFLFVEKKHELARVPESLRQMLGALEKVMDLQLDERRILAQVDALTVMRQIEEQGYYLQMPLQPGCAPSDS